MAEREDPRPIVLTAPSPRWHARFVEQSGILRAALGATLLEVHHIGGTSLPTLWSRPIVDVMALARALEAVDVARGALEAAGYLWRGEHGVSGRRSLIRCDPDGVRTVNVHIFEATHAAVRRHLAFRDHLLARPLVASSYERLKRDVASRHDRARYAAAKAAFIEAALRDAMGTAYRPLS